MKGGALMPKTIRMQTPTRSSLNVSQLCSFDQEVISNPCKPLIHSEARMWYINSGNAVITLQGRTYRIGANSVVSILPWQITEIVEVFEPLQYYLVVYNPDSVNRLMKAYYDEPGQMSGWMKNTENVPVLQCGGDPSLRIKALFERLREELGVESTIQTPEPQRYGNILSMNYLLEINVLLERMRSKLHGTPPINDGALDKSEILRYMFVHLSEKLTLKMLSRIFYCSESAISSYINHVTGMSFFDLLNEMRIGKTANYLLYTDLTLEELAEILGYVDASHISKTFSSKIGMRIGEYRKTYQKVADICQIDESRLVYSVINTVYRSYQTEMTTQHMAETFGVSVGELNRIFLCQVERNFEDFLNYIRIVRACELLLQTDRSINEIAFEVGYNSTKTFTRHFLKQMAMPPSVFRGSLEKAPDKLQAPK